MILKRVIFFIAIGASLLSCSSDETSNDLLPSQDKVEVLLSANQASTRTSIEDDLITTRWSTGDQIALWATGSDDGIARFSGECFTLRYFGADYSTAEFSGLISPMDDIQTYKYKGFYPYVKTVSGTDVTYTIASTQSGEFDGLNDFRVADEVEGKALSNSTMGGCNLAFRSLTHALRITIPEGECKLDDGISIVKLAVTLPFDAVGSLSFDMANTDSTPTFTADAGKSVVLDFASSPLTPGDGQYVWLFMNPATNVSGDIKISATGENGAVTDNYIIPISNHTFSAGCVTPVNTRVEEEISYTINFLLGTNNLGESINKITLTTLDGSNITSGSSSIDIDIDSTTQAYSFYPRIADLAGRTYSVTYESTHAKISGDNITIAEFEPGTFDLSVGYSVPYLLYQDFSGLASDISSCDQEELGANLSDILGQSAPTEDLGDYGLTGWSASRIGGKEGNAIRICGRDEAYQTYNGWIKSPTLTSLKSSTKIKVTYSYSGGKEEWSSGLFSYSGTPKHTDPSGSTQSQGTSYGDWAGNSTTFSSRSCSVTATSSTAITWTATYSRTNAVLQNGNYWLYLDNIIVEIDE